MAGWYRPGPVPAVLLVLLAASSPDVVCLDVGVCTPISRLGKQGDAELVRHTERLPAHIEPGTPFAAWMTWPRPPEAVRKRVQQKQPVEVRAVIPAARLRLAVAPGVLTEGTEPGVLVFLSSDPLAGASTPLALPEAIAGAESLDLLTPAQKSEVGRWRTAAASWQSRLTSEWTAFTRAPRTASVRTKLLDTLGSPPVALVPEQLLTEAQRTELRRKGHALEGRIVVEDLPGDAYRLRVEGVPLDQLVEEWNAGLHGLVGRLERVPRPRFQVRPGHRHDEVTFTLDVRSDVDELRMSQVARRLSAIPGLEADGTRLPPPGL
ncbi:MAG TPA: hypothetical protein VFN91_00710 [Myxococcaceae bacterium]|nr:hypothetical protein [Myxococcaceae bacterium]